MPQRIMAAVGQQLANLAFAYAKAHLGAVSSAVLVAMGDMAKSGGQVPAGDWKAIAGAAGLSWVVVAITSNTRAGVVVPPLDSAPTSAPTPVFVGTLPPAAE